jgi:nucleoside-diphosphate-sugar epimerase
MTKAEGEVSVQRMIDEDQLRAVIIRPGTIFGPGSTLNLGRIADRLRAGRWIIVGSGRNALPLVYVSDVVRGLLLALDQPHALGKAFNIGNDLPLSQREFLTALAREIGAKPPRLRVPYRVLYTAAYVAERSAEVTGSRREPVVTRHGVNLFGTDNRHAIDKAGRELGYTPQVPLTEGIRLAAAWYKQVASAHGHAPESPANRYQSFAPLQQGPTVGSAISSRRPSPTLSRRRKPSRRRAPWWYSET